ncbi:MAG: PepSY domain-containing protein [Elusimicrobia bacterium]|nr:PepSY domain-containing protein [Elusimicrobiota bacterium]
MRRGQHLRHAIRTFAGAALLATAGLVPRQAYAVRGSAVARADAKRFGLDQFSRPRRRDPSVRSRSAFDSFNQAHGGRWKIRFDGRTGMPSALVEGASGPHPGRPQEAAAAFLAEQRGMLGVDPAALAVERVVSGGGQHHVLYRQTYRGLPVEFARVKVHLDARGAVTGVHSRFEPDLAVDIVPTLTAAQAAAAVRRDAGVAPSSRAALVVFPDENSGQARLAWKFTARDKSALWRYYIDAHSGAVLFRYNDLRFFTLGCLSTGTVSGQVYDVDPLRGALQVRPFRHQYVYVVDASTSAETYYDDPATGGYGDGHYCSTKQGAMFTQLQGPYVNVSNFRGPSVHYDNGGGLWYTGSTPVSSPHPYPGSVTLISTVTVTDSDPTHPSNHKVVKVLPIFDKFEVGTVGGAINEASAVIDDDELAVLDPAGNPVGTFFGNRGAFRGAAVAGDSYYLRLKSNDQPGGQYGYDVSLSSYMVLPNPGVSGVSDLVWSTGTALEGMRSEISLFYHLNLMHDFFNSGIPAGTPYGAGYIQQYAVNKDGAADINSHPVDAIALLGPNVSDPFYNPDYDNLNFGDTSIGGQTPSDSLTDDATVPRHEYTHYVVEKIWSIQNFGQAGAISEGLADYFAATSLDDSSIGAYYNYPEAPLRELDCRNPAKSWANGKCSKLCSGTACNPLPVNGYLDQAWNGEIHADSIFFSQALWDIRADQIARLNPSVGQACADGLVFQALQFFPESFEEFLDALKRVDSQGLVPACGGPVQNSSIIPRFNAHGLLLGGGVNELHTGFESALDVSTYTVVTGTISPPGHTDFYTFGAGPGQISIIMKLPVHSVPSDGYYMGYGLTLYDLRHKPVVTVPSEFAFCDQSDCTSAAPTVVLNYRNESAGQFFLQVAGGFESGVSSLLPYTLTFDYPRSGALEGSVVNASMDHDIIKFSVVVTTWPQKQDYSFAYAQLRDQARNVIPDTISSNTFTFLNVVPGSMVNALGMITGQVQLTTETTKAFTQCSSTVTFSCRFPSVGTIYLEVFGYNVTGSTVSLGLSNAINLTSDGGAQLTAYNNIFNPLRGEKATVKYEVQTAGRVTIKLYTLNGTLVGTLFDGDVPAGKGSVDWFGNNGAGNRVASGVYLVHMSGPGGSKTQKIVVVK